MGSLQKLIIGLLIICTCHAVVGVKKKVLLRKNYEGYSTYGVHPITEKQKNILRSLSKYNDVDFWSNPAQIPVTMTVPPDAKDHVLQILNSNSIQHTVMIPNVERALSKARQSTRGNRQQSNFDRYLKLHEIYRFLEDIAAQHKNISRLEIVGHTQKGTPIPMIKISNNSSAGYPVTFIEAGMHAREWAAPAMALYIIDNVVHNSNFLKQRDWHIIPTANPDGYKYSHKTDRLWRKSRSWVPSMGKCIGVDGNRNFDAGWEFDNDHNPCSPTFGGISPFSEAETQAIRNATVHDKWRIRNYLSLHSFGSFILYPYGYEKKLTKDWIDMDSCARTAATIISNHGGEEFTVGNTAYTLYASPGGSDDFAKLKYRTPFAYTVELPGGGDNGFDLPPDQLKSMLQKTAPGILYLGQC